MVDCFECGSKSNVIFIITVHCDRCSKQDKPISQATALCPFDPHAQGIYLWHLTSILIAAYMNIFLPWYIKFLQKFNIMCVCVLFTNSIFIWMYFITIITYQKYNIKWCPWSVNTNILVRSNAITKITVHLKCCIIQALRAIKWNINMLKPYYRIQSNVPTVTRKSFV